MPAPIQQETPISALASRSCATDPVFRPGETDLFASATSSNRIVIISDDPMTLRLLKAKLSGFAGDAHFASTYLEGLDSICETTQVAIVDLWTSELSSLQVIGHLQQYHPRVQCILLSNSGEDAAAAMEAGVLKYVEKPFDAPALVSLLQQAMESHPDPLPSNAQHSASPIVRQTAPVSATVTGYRDVGLRLDSNPNRPLDQQIDQVAKSESNVFIGGETGTGKSTIARTIHERSHRHAGPFVSVNCSSLPKDLIQSELFGHTKGSFTGAVADRAGHAEHADGGTLFLDEIGDLPIELQPKLLTFIQDRVVQRLGSNQSKQVDVRLIAATHRDLAHMCREGLFRADLYFRLMVLNLEVPALRMRTAELPSIARNILWSICIRQGVPEKSFTQASMELLCSHSWPGNIRELENVIERAVAFSHGPCIEPNDLIISKVELDRRSVDRQPSAPQLPPQQIEQRDDPTRSQPADLARPSSVLDQIDFSNSRENGARGEASSKEASSEEDFAKPDSYVLAGKTLEQIERDAIVQTLQMLDGNKAKTARTLGISEKSIYNKMRRLNITY